MLDDHNPSCIHWKNGSVVLNPSILGSCIEPNRFLLITQKNQKPKQTNLHFPAKSDFWGLSSSIAKLKKWFEIHDRIIFYSKTHFSFYFHFTSRLAQKKKIALNNHIIIVLFVNRNNKNTVQQTKYFSYSLVHIHDNLVRKVKQIHQKTHCVFSALQGIKS